MISKFLNIFHSKKQTKKASATDVVVDAEECNPQDILNYFAGTQSKRSSANQASPQLDEEENKKEIEVPFSKIPMDGKFKKKSRLKIEFKENSDFKIPSRIDLFTKLDVTEKDDIFVRWNPEKNDTSENNNSYLKLLPKALLVNNTGEVVGFFEIKTYNEDGKKKSYLTAKAEKINLAKLKNSTCDFVFCDASAARSSKIKLFWEYILFKSPRMALFKKPIKVEFHETEVTPTHLCIDFGTSNTTAGCYLDDHYVENIFIDKKDLNSAHIVSFIDKERVDSKDDLDTITYKNILPTIVYVADCADRDNVEYRFGFEATRAIEDDHYCPKGTCFMEIKRWTSEIDKPEDIEDPRGNKATVSRGDVVGKFLQYVIKTAENRFKCKFKNIHITSPVKLKEDFLECYSKILSTYEYELEKENAIDEGFAVLFETIDQNIKEGKYNEDPKKVLIIDWGGGTSDLASCEYSITKGNNGVIYPKIKTEYLNGDVNFGGNKLTYRIMQFMKIVYAQKVRSKENKNDDDPNNSKITPRLKQIIDSKRPKSFDELCKSNGRVCIDDLITDDSDKLISYIEGTSENADETEVKKRYDDVYRGFEKAYEAAEDVIPTKFNGYETQTKDEYDKKKNNFYFLWKLADEMKKAFFGKTISGYAFVIKGDIKGDIKDDKKDDKKSDDLLQVGRIKDWRLSVRKMKNDSLTEPCHKTFYRTFDYREIEKLLRADIYYNVRKFLNDLYMSNSLDDYKTIRLSGQSSRISIFMDLLKEFLPGRKIQGKIFELDEKESEEKKLACLKGAIAYQYAVRTSKFEPTRPDENETPNNETTNIPFSVYVKTSDGKEEELIRRKEKDKNGNERPAGWNQPAGKGALTTSGSVVDLFMRNADSNVHHKYNVCEKDKYSKTTVKEIEKLSFGLISQKDALDYLPADENKKYFFVYLNKRRRGFNIMPIFCKGKKDGKEDGEKDRILYRGPVEFFPFDAEDSQKSFFDGKH